MSRLRVPLATLVVGLLAAGLVAWDVVRSAEASIRGHRQEMESYFAQEKDVQRSRPPLLDPPLPGEAWDTYRAAFARLLGTPAVSAFLLSASFKIEDPAADLAAARPELDAVRDALRQRWVPPPDPGEVDGNAYQVLEWTSHLAHALVMKGRDRDAMELVTLTFGVAQDFARVNNSEDAARFFNFIEDASEAGLRALEAHALGAGDLEGLCASLDRLESGRPLLSEAFDWGRLYWKRKALVEVLPKYSLRSRGRWTDFSSERLVQARALAQIDAHHRANAERGRRPPWERVQPVPHGEDEHAVIASLYSTYFCCVPNLNFESEVRALERRTLLRVALAAAWHQAERGMPAASLQDLAPRFLKEVPVSPLDGKPFGYGEGTLVSRDLKGPVRRWPINRR